MSKTFTRILIGFVTKLCVPLLVGKMYIGTPNRPVNSVNKNSSTSLLDSTSPNGSRGRSKDEKNSENSKSDIRQEEKAGLSLFQTYIEGNPKYITSSQPAVLKS